MPSWPLYFKLLKPFSYTTHLSTVNNDKLMLQRQSLYPLLPKNKCYSRIFKKPWTISLRLYIRTLIQPYRLTWTLPRGLDLERWSFILSLMRICFIAVGLATAWLSYFSFFLNSSLLPKKITSRQSSRLQVLFWWLKRLGI